MHLDGASPVARVRPTGSKQFIQIVRIDGKRYERGLGGCQFTDLDEARGSPSRTAAGCVTARTCLPSAAGRKAAYEGWQGTRRASVQAALRVLDEAHDEYGGEGLMFPSKRGKMLYDAAITQDLLRKQLGIEATAHGFRSSFRDWVAEHGWERDVAEAALAHTLGNATELAYKRTDFLAKRCKMMEAWARFCMGRGTPLGRLQGLSPLGSVPAALDAFRRHHWQLRR